MPINESGSDPFWVNDTIEVFRVCPEYGTQNTSETATIIGRNFRDSDILVCRFIPCASSAFGPRKCENLATSAISNNHKSIEASATYISETRVQCPLPEYVFPSNDSLIVLDGVCEHDELGNLAYVQSCEADTISDGSCEDDAGAGYRFVYDVLVSCVITRGVCIKEGFDFEENLGSEQRQHSYRPCAEQKSVFYIFSSDRYADVPYLTRKSRCSAPRMKWSAAHATTPQCRRECGTLATPLRCDDFKGLEHA